MSKVNKLTVQQVHDMVMANQVIRAPNYEKDQAGRQWGRDLIPALMNLFRVDKDPSVDHSNSWVGFARHWTREIFRLGFDLVSGPRDSDLTLVLTSISGQEEKKGSGIIEDADIGVIELPTEVPTKKECERRSREYQKIRDADTSDETAAVQAFMAALPDWMQKFGTEFDQLVEREVPNVFRAVKWHIPFYGIEGEGWFASFGNFSKYVKISFLRGISLDPEPPVEVNNQETRCVHLREMDEFDENQMSSWVKQAAALPGWNP